jgi:hypothetical protein
LNMHTMPMVNRKKIRFVPEHRFDMIGDDVGMWTRGKNEREEKSEYNSWAVFIQASSKICATELEK